MAKEKDTTSIDCIEKMVRGLIGSETMSAQDFFIAVHNALVHGEITPNIGDRGLKDLFTDLDEIIEMCEKESI
jgi:hypothetical protein